MKSRLASALTRTLALANSFPTRRTHPEQLKSLLRQLHPKSTNIPLRRLGPLDDDGGYLIPDDLDGLTGCFSPGVSTESGFELDCAKLGIPVHMADLSVDGPGAQHENFHFIQKFVGAVSDRDHITMEEWIRSTNTPEFADIIIQMDIEFMEYEVLLALPDSILRQTRILIVEFHRLEQLWNEPFFCLAERVFSKILQTHECVHIHPNNCFRPHTYHGISIPPIMEFTFFRKDRLSESSLRSDFPHPLDQDNTKNMPPLPLPKCWFGGQV
ncbi:MAG: hypothetical protein H6686_11820 [Fibrobacteria bacterium]|nr:hypothetical protein [Fibrobacteria bacterium]